MSCATISSEYVGTKLKNQNKKKSTALCSGMLTERRRCWLQRQSNHKRAHESKTDESIKTSD